MTNIQRAIAALSHHLIGLSLTDEEAAELEHSAVAEIRHRRAKPVPETAPPTDACTGCGGPLFAVGDVVVLASGSPELTIARLGDDTEHKDEAFVVWFDEDGHDCDRWLPLAVLEHAQPADCANAAG